jgi:hypothetical protein
MIAILSFSFYNNKYIGQTNTAVSTGALARDGWVDG